MHALGKIFYQTSCFYVRDSQKYFVANVLSLYSIYYVSLSVPRFTESPDSLMLASDVAARGLDFPNVQHVIHYHVGVAYGCGVCDVMGVAL